jgi:hypothetical protein
MYIGINLWLAGGNTPVNQKDYEIVIRNVSFTP